MKKLLLILLLLFPVHGAWANNHILNLSCTVSIGGEDTHFNPIIDLDNKIVINPHGGKMGIAKINSNNISYKSKDSKGYMYTSINRNTGEVTVNFDDSPYFQGFCNKVKKNKF